MLFKLSAELRLFILRELLIVDRPVVVYGGWRLAHRHRSARGLSLCAAILRTNKCLNAEGNTVLYGENTFLYLLRDPKPVVTDVLRLAYDDGDGGGTQEDRLDEGDGYNADDDSASDWERDGGGAPTRPTRRRANKPKCDIDVDKYRPLIRHIVEAEHNRFGTSIKVAMAGAISAFGRATSANVDTLTVRVAPIRDTRADGDGDDQQQQPPPPSFTFFDFFEPESPVLAAIQDAKCRFLRVDVMTHHMGVSAERAGYRYTVDRRPEICARQSYVDVCSRPGRGPPSDIATHCEVKMGALRACRALEGFGASVRHICLAWDGRDPVDDAL